MEESLIAADGDVFIDFFGVDAAGIFKNDVGLMPKERLIAGAEKACDGRSFCSGENFGRVTRRDVLIEDVARFAGDEWAQRTKTHAAYAANTAIRAGALDFGFESRLDGFTVKREATGSETDI